MKESLTAEERRDMLKLGYTVEEVDMMRIEIAQKLLASSDARLETQPATSERQT